MLEVKNGNHEVFEELVERHQRWGWTVAYRFLGDAPLAEDLVQEAFVKIFEAREDYEPTASFRTYFQRVLIRSCIDYQRKNKPVYADELEDRSRSRQNPEDRLDQQEVNEAINRILTELPDRQRMALILKYLKNLSYEEIAERMDCTEKAVESLLGRARSSFNDQAPEWLKDRVKDHEPNQKEMYS